MGRPKEFDVDRALDRAIDVFWARGYEATSIQDLVDATGVNRQSLYDTFGDKHGLYLAALRRYCATQSGAVDRLKRPAAHPLRLLRDFFLATADDSTCDGRGCMLVAAAVERVTVDPTVEEIARANLSALEEAFTALLEHARAAGELSPRLDVRVAARALVTLLWGVRTVGHAQRDRAWLAEVVDHAVAALAPTVG